MKKKICMISQCPHKCFLTGMRCNHTMNSTPFVRQYTTADKRGGCLKNYLMNPICGAILWNACSFLCSKAILFSSNRFLPDISIETISGPNSFSLPPKCFWHAQFFPEMPSDVLHLHRGYYCSQQGKHVDCSNCRHAFCVCDAIPPFPTISRTPVFSMGSYSNCSIRILVVGPTDTISYLFSFDLTDNGTHMKGIARSQTPSIGSERPSSTRRRCATSRHVTRSPSNREYLQYEGPPDLLL